MSKTLLASLLVAATAAFLLVSGTGVAKADPGNGAIVIKNDGVCGSRALTPTATSSSAGSAR